jgi:membrane fusion protein, heavy metal efflux system
MRNNIYISICFLSLAACSGNQELDSEENEPRTFLELSAEQMEIAQIEFGQPERKEISSLVEFTGSIEVPPQNLVSFHAPITAFVSNIPFIEGDIIKKGQRVLSLEHPDLIILQQEYLKELSQLLQLEREYERQSTLLAGNATSAKKAQEAENLFNIQKAKVAGIESRLTFLRINSEEVKKGNIQQSISLVSPVNGIITFLGVNQGKLAQSNELLIEIVDREHLHVEIRVFERDIPSIKLGQRFEFTLPGNALKPYFGDIYLIGQMVDPVSKTILLHGHPDEEVDAFIPGMQIKGKIYTDAQISKVVPVSAIVKSGNESYVFVYSKGRFLRVSINEGRTFDGYAEIGDLDLEGELVKNGVWFLESEWWRY